MNVQVAKMLVSRSADGLTDVFSWDVFFFVNAWNPGQKWWKMVDKWYIFFSFLGSTHPASVLGWRSDGKQVLDVASENMRQHPLASRVGNQYWKVGKYHEIFCLCAFIVTFNMYTTCINVSQWLLNIWQIKKLRSPKSYNLYGCSVPSKFFDRHLPKGLHRWCGAVNQEIGWKVKKDIGLRSPFEQWKDPGWLGCGGDSTTQLHKDFNEPLYRSLLTNQRNGMP